ATDGLGGFRAEVQGRQIHAGPDSGEQSLGNQHDVVATFAQRRQLQLDHVEAVVEVLAEQALVRQCLEVPVGGGHQPHIDLLRLDRADAADLAFLQYPQQPGLGLQGQLADLVEEQGTAVGGFYQAGTAGDRAGKGALLVPEQLGFDEGFRNRRTGYREHRRMGPGGVLVQGAGNQLLAGAGFTADQYRGHGRRDLADALEQRLHGRAGADDAHILRPLCRGGSLAWRPFRLAAGFYDAGHRL